HGFGALPRAQGRLPARMRSLRIDVDVTPIRDGGECGGAKPFVLGLLEGLGRSSRRHDYRLLTGTHNHESFARFEALGFNRFLVDEAGRAAPNAAIRPDLLFCPMTAPTYAQRDVPTLSVLYDLQHEAFPFFFT